MATGGTIPSNRQQYVTFYNTTGVVEKDKNIYLAPRFSKENPAIAGGSEVRLAYLRVFNRVCPPSSNYTAIEISSWSPQDRTLKVRGNVDDFRLVTEEGDCLNYFIITRTVTKGEGQLATSKTFYYGFFITGVQQAGGGSVSLTVEPDDFTNVFYLHNTHQLTALEISNDYEPFNEKLKNCYVNRQHYNRVKYTTDILYNLLTVDILSLSPANASAFNVGDSIRLEFDSRGRGVVVEGKIENISLYSESHVKLIVKTNERHNIEEPENISYLIIGGVTYSFNYVAEDIEWETFTNTYLEPDNMKVFLNQEESYRYKYQYRDLKYPISIYDGNFTEEEMQQIENENTFNNLSQDLRKKILKSCLSYLVIETKSAEICKPYYYENLRTNPQQDTQVAKYRLRVGQLVNDNIKRPNVVLAYPYLEIPEVFNKYNLSDWVAFIWCNSTYDYRPSLAKVLERLSKNSIADYVYSVYYSKDVNLPDSIITFDFTNKRVLINSQVNTPSFTLTDVRDYDLNKGVYFADILEEPISSDADITSNNSVHIILENGQITLVSSGNYCRGIIVSGYKNNIVKINIKENLKDLKTNFYDNVLEAEPYSFYSLSYLSGYEMTFNKNRYYESVESEITVLHYVSFNGALKEGYIPLYKVEGCETRYYNEGMIFTTSATMPLVSDSYSSYYYQNKAQMKNQYAVADYQWGSDFAQKVFVSSPNQVGISASKRGGYGALAETGNQVMGWVDDAIDLAQNKHVTEMNQKSKLADMGTKPDSLKQVGSDLMFDLSTLEVTPFLNHYTIDEISYNSIAKLLERTGYQVNLYDTLNTMDRVGWNFIKLNSFDYVADITVSQETSIRNILTNGVTLLHDKTYLTSGHNFETILEGGD